MRTPEIDDPSTPKPVLVEGLKVAVQVEQVTIFGNQVEIEKKFAIATACVIFALLGAPIAFRFPRSGVGMTIGVSLAVFGVYYCGLVLGESLARRGIVPPFIAMWSTNAMLLTAGVFLTARLGNEGTTHRGSEMSEWWGRFLDRIRKRSATPA
jgi:lipopolysaccharide export system permease protein